MRATGAGSWPGTSARDAVRAVRDLLGDGHLPYLPEMPARGPGADMLGRTAGLLVEMPVDLQPSGWRLTDAPGRDVRRAESFLREDLDELAEAYDGWRGPLKVQVCGPWTLAGALWLPRGERVVTDTGARRDLVDSLALGVTDHLTVVQRLVPGAELVLQVDEPGLPAALAGRLPTASGYGRTPALDPGTAEDGLWRVLAAAGDRRTVVHCCAPEPPWMLLRRLAPGALFLDVSLLTPRTWESAATGVEAGSGLVAGLMPTDRVIRPDVAASDFLQAWRRVGLEEARLGEVTTAPACGLASVDLATAVAIQRSAVQAAHELTDVLTA